MESKEYNSKYLTQTEVLDTTACELAQIIPLAGGNVGDLRVYDGEDAQGELKLRVRIPANGSRPFVFNPHVYLRRGLYVVFTEQIDGCFVQWSSRPSREG